MLLNLVLNYHHLLLMLKYIINNDSIIMTFQNSLFIFLQTVYIL